MGNKAVFVAGVVPCAERADVAIREDRHFADKREIKHNKGVWRMPWH